MKIVQYETTDRRSRSSSNFDPNCNDLRKIDSSSATLKIPQTKPNCAQFILPSCARSVACALIGAVDRLALCRRRNANFEPCRIAQDNAECCTSVECHQPWSNPATSRPTTISDERLTRLARELLPVEILGDPVQSQINRTRTGWVIELVNNRGVAKKPGEPAVIDPQGKARVTLKPKVRFTSAREWRSKVVHERAKEIVVKIGPGQSEFVEFVGP